VSLKDMIREARHLSVDERKQLAKALVDMLAESMIPAAAPKRSARDYRGRGAHLYDGTDAQAQVDRLRHEWDERP
jgi:hypothetical protein